MTSAGSPCFYEMYSAPSFDSGNARVGGWFCARDGEFGGSQTVRMNGSGFGSATGIVGPTGIDDYYIRVLGVDAASSTYLSYYAPRGSRIFSPVTSLIQFSGNQDSVKRALGISGSLFNLAQDRDFTTFDVVAALSSTDEIVRADAERAAAANLRALAVLIPTSEWDTYLPYALESYDELGAFMAARPTFMFENEVMSQYVDSRYGGRLDPRVVSAIAHLIDAYVATIPVRVSDETMARRALLGIHGYLVPAVNQLVNSNSLADAEAAQAVTAQTIRDATQTYLNGYAIPTSGRFFPAPNFAETSGGSITLQADGIGGTRAGSLVSNDLFAQGVGEGATGLAGGDAEVTGVSVPAEFASAIMVNLVGITSKTVTVSTLGGFRGRAYFDYAVRHPGGATGTARVYVNFK